MEKIISLQNPRIKQIVKLRQHRERWRVGRFIIEGHRELSMAIASGVEIINLFLCPEFIKSNKKIIGINDEIKIEVSKEVFAKISCRENPDGFLAEAKMGKHNLEDVLLSNNPLVLVLGAMENTGNLGAILRSADAAGVDAIIVSAKTDIYNPNAIRASQGTLFTKQVATACFGDILAWLKEKKIRIFATTSKANKIYSKVDFCQPTAIVMGAEDVGLSEDWLKSADESIKIPMKGKVSSLNVSVSAAVIIFEAIRQRDQKTLKQ